MYDVIVIGGGASGMSTALYCKRAGMNVLIIERELFGGQLNNTNTIENYIGVGNISGDELSSAMHDQILENNIEVKYMNVKSVKETENGLLVENSKNSIKTKSVVLATGVKHKELGITGELENQGEGVSYCAICDGFAFKDKKVAVIGGGDSAFEEGLFLSNIAESVSIIYYRGKENLKVKSELYDRFMSKKNTNIFYNSKINKIEKRPKYNASLEDELLLYCESKGLTGREELDNIVNSSNKSIYGLITDGVFIYVGVEPVNEIAKESGISLDKQGYVIIDDKYMTSMKNVFAVGDLIHPDMKQVSIAVADGAIVSKHIKEVIQ